MMADMRIAPRGRIGRSARGLARRRLSTAMALAALVGLWAPVSAGAQGRPYRLPGLQGGELRPSDLNQGVTIAVVWASWSPRCRDIVERVNAIVNRWGRQARVVMVDFQEDRSEVEAFLSGKSARAPVYLDEDGAFSKNHSVTNLPGLVIFKDGSIAFSGKLSRDPDSVIAQALG